MDPPAENASAPATSHAIAPATAVAAPETSGPNVLTLAGITVSGSLDAYATFNPARTASSSGPNDLYVFETQANGASVSLAKIALERKAAPVGFRLDVGFGSTIDVVNSTDAAAGHDVMRNLEQAFVSWAATPSLTLKAGKMVTHHGMEVIESQANWNYTHSLLFTWAIPFTQTGIAADWAVNDKLEATLFVVNGLNNTFEGNAFKSPGLQVIYKPSSALTLTQNFSAFNEQPGDAGGLTRFDLAVYLFDTVAT
ncbi:MAG TPA: outer membrane beta-barrel protein, partial [Kofleriaceae bacterium]|nr:outer membrane beta-barrel protein [Kofleriaceae bacterium]